MSVNLADYNRYRPGDFNPKSLRAQAKYMVNNYRNYAFIMAEEELAELTKAVSKFIRFEGNPNSLSSNRLDILEEIADAYWALELMIARSGINRDEIKKMMAYKYDKRQHYISTGTIIQGKMQDTF